MDHLFGFFKSEACDQTIEYMYGQFLQRQYRDFSDTNSTPVTVYAELLTDAGGRPNGRKTFASLQEIRRQNFMQAETLRRLKEKRPRVAGPFQRSIGFRVGRVRRRVLKAALLPDQQYLPPPTWLHASLRVLLQAGPAAKV